MREKLNKKSVYLALMGLVALFSVPVQAQEALAGQPGVSLGVQMGQVRVGVIDAAVDAIVTDMIARVDTLADTRDALLDEINSLQAQLDAVKACTEGIASFDGDGNVTCEVAPFCSSGSLLSNGNTTECRTADEPTKSIAPPCSGGFNRVGRVNSAGNTEVVCTFDHGGGFDAGIDGGPGDGGGL